MEIDHSMNSSSRSHELKFLQIARERERERENGIILLDEYGTKDEMRLTRL